MATDSIVLDPSSGSINLNNGSAYQLVKHEYPTPASMTQYAGSADTEGDVPVAMRPANRQIPITVRVLGTSAADIDANIAALQQKLAKIKREGGVYQRTTPSGLVVKYDLVDVEYKPTFDKTYVNRWRSDVDLTFTAMPYGYGTESTLADHTETTLPCLIFTEATIAGDVPPLARLVIDDDNAANQRAVIWGVQSRNYDASADAALFYQAETRTLLNGATLQTRAGASGAGSNVVRSPALTTTYQAVLSTQASGGGNHLSHKGSFAVYAGTFAQNGQGNSRYSIALEWGIPGGTYQRNDPVTLPYNLQTVYGACLYLGNVYLPDSVTRWEARILAAAGLPGANQTLDIDYLMFVPLDEGAGIVSSTAPRDFPSVITAREEFSTGTSGDLNGRTSDGSAVWTAKTAAEWTTAIDTINGGSVSRSTASASWAVLASPVATDTVVQVTLSTTNINMGGRAGVIARYVDNLHFVTWGIKDDSLVMSFDGTNAYPVAVDSFGNVLTSPTVPFLPLTATEYTVRLMIDSDGHAYGWAWPTATGVPGEPLIHVWSASLATGGGLASGKVGIADNGTAGTRTYKHFVAGTPAFEYAVRASQSVEIGSTGVRHEDASGTLWLPAPNKGDYLHVPPSGREARTARFVVKPLRHGSIVDGNFDDTSARLYVTPRWLTNPEA